MAFSYEDVLTRGRDIERLGYHSMWLYDHFYGPFLPDLDSFEAWTLATYLLAQTETLRLGHLVLCANFRHPALLGKMVSTLDVLSGGRYEVGLGSGSVEREHHEVGLPWGPFAERSERLGEALAVVTEMMKGDPLTFEGKYFSIHDLPNRPAPARRPPVHVGGVGPKYTLPLVARYADVWNIPVYGLADWRQREQVLIAECEKIGRDHTEIRRSHEAVLVIGEDEEALATARAKAERRYPGPTWGIEEGGYVGTPEQVVDRIERALDEGVDFFIFFTHDRAERRTLELFAERVAPAFA
jgi:alkanesulfonate monooxygenase SsuD/methylene tetrahydromethanopterin reductase-like flavin-dependent oxidoreductase (luciferase family)